MSNEGPERDMRPWGYFDVLADFPDCKVKRIVVLPGTRLSLQRHSQRDEHWFIVSGDAVVTIDGKDTRLGRGMSIDIPRTCLHRVENIGTVDLLFVEIQTGEHFGEDDIERVEDDYGRA